MGGPLLVDESQVVKLLSVPDSIRLAREAYIRLSRGKALNPERVLLRVPGGASAFVMPAHILGQNTVTVKVARLNLKNPERLLPSVMATVYVYDSTTGRELAQVEADALTALRTAASSAVASDLLAGKNCETLGIIGTGKQAEAHVPALLEVRKFSRILVYSRNKTRREAFAASSMETHNIRVKAASSPEEVAESSDVLVLATNSQVPLFNGNLVQPGTHVNAIGAASPEAREVDSSLVKHSRLVVDSIAQAMSSYGDIMIPLREGAIAQTDLVELGELLVHPAKPARKEARTSLFKSGGLAVLDAAMANHIVSQASQPAV